ncbi:hypothetical protein [uncultured Acetobacterium sp.]|uniref:hypothetical protein n=1 Tax=uncultured Acetobacterium sp. TaxID=217139 RepID=UPI0025D223C3|nr:hypothetical protein [uncultured Acetobacterium sp.]
MVNVLIQRITAVTGDNNIAGSGLNLAELFQKLPAIDVGDITVFLIRRKTLEKSISLVS